MKFNTVLVALMVQFAGVLSVSSEIDASAAALVEECGDLGVMEVPEGADPANYRKCADHPLGASRRKYEQSLAPSDLEEFEKRSPAELKGADIFGRAAQACYYDAGLGCSGGYCWKACGSNGQWCWTAANANGDGNWFKCSTYTQCNTGMACGSVGYQCANYILDLH